MIWVLEEGEGTPLVGRCGLGIACRTSSSPAVFAFEARGNENQQTSLSWRLPSKELTEGKRELPTLDRLHPQVHHRTALPKPRRRSHAVQPHLARRHRQTPSTRILLPTRPPRRPVTPPSRHAAIPPLPHRPHDPDSGGLMEGEEGGANAVPVPVGLVCPPRGFHGKSETMKAAGKV